MKVFSRRWSRRPPRSESCIKSESSCKLNLCRIFFSQRLSLRSCFFRQLLSLYILNVPPKERVWTVLVVLFFLPSPSGGCFLPCGSRSQDWTLTSSTTSPWTSCPWTTRDTGTYGDVPSHTDYCTRREVTSDTDDHSQPAIESNRLRVLSHARVWMISPKASDQKVGRIDWRSPSLASVEVREWLKKVVHVPGGKLCAWWISLDMQ